MSGRLQARDTSGEWDMGGQETKAGPGVGAGALSTHIYVDRKPI